VAYHIRSEVIELVNTTGKSDKQTITILQSTMNYTARLISIIKIVHYIIASTDFNDAVIERSPTHNDPIEHTVTI